MVGSVEVDLVEGCPVVPSLLWFGSMLARWYAGPVVHGNMVGSVVGGK